MPLRLGWAKTLTYFFESFMNNLFVQQIEIFDQTVAQIRESQKTDTYYFSIFIFLNFFDSSCHFVANHNLLLRNYFACMKMSLRKMNIFIMLALLINCKTYLWKYLVRALKILEFHTKAAMHRETPFWIGENSILKGEVGFTYWENDYF